MVLYICITITAVIFDQCLGFFAPFRYSDLGTNQLSEHDIAPSPPKRNTQAGRLYKGS